MSFEMMLWKVAGTKLEPISASALDQEKRLEDWIAADPPHRLGRHREEVSAVADPRPLLVASRPGSGMTSGSPATSTGIATAGEPESLHGPGLAVAVHAAGAPRTASRHRSHSAAGLRSISSA